MMVYYILFGLHASFDAATGAGGAPPALGHLHHKARRDEEDLAVVKDDPVTGPTAALPP